MAGILDGILGGVIGGDQANMGNGILGNINSGLTNNAGMLMSMGSALLGGQGWGQAAANGLQGMQMDQRTRLLQQAQAEKVQKQQALRDAATKLGVDPNLAAASPETFAAVAAKKLVPKDLTFEERQFNQLSPDQQAAYRQKHFLNGGGTYGLNPIYGVDQSGNPAIVQLNNQGGASQVQLPNGIKLSKDPIKLDAGTHWVLLDPVTRQTIGSIPKNIAEAASQQEQGRAQGQAVASAPNQIESANQALDLLNQLETHPGFSSAVGWQSVFPTMNGTPAAGFENLLKQAQGGAFLNAIQQLRGLGALSDAEGKAATAAATRMSTATSEVDFKKALSDYRDIVLRGKQRAMQRMGGQTPTAPQDATATPSRDALKQKYGLE